MAKFNLMHCLPDPKLHGLYGYLEVIESVDWGLKQLGHSVTYKINDVDSAAINIIFGAQVLPIDQLKALPENSIIYNFEQMRGIQEIRPEILFFAERFQVWEYSSANLERWTELGFNSVKVVPVGYAPSLTRIPKFNIQDIDVLIYGLPGNKRLDAFYRLSQTGLTTLFACGLYGEARDTLIARSKIVLNVNLYDQSQIFEVVRVSYLLANKKAVVATLDANTFVESDFADSVKFTTIEKIADDCFDLLKSDSDRLRLETAGYESFVKRDVRKILKSALDG